MGKFIITWNAGYGEEWDLIDAENHEEAEQIAYDTWKETVESNADYNALEFTKDNAESYGFEDEWEDENND